MFEFILNDCATLIDWLNVLQIADLYAKDPLGLELAVDFWCPVEQSTTFDSSMLPCTTTPLYSTPPPQRQVNTVADQCVTFSSKNGCVGPPACVLHVSFRYSSLLKKPLLSLVNRQPRSCMIFLHFVISRTWIYTFMFSVSLSLLSN